MVIREFVVKAPHSADIDAMMKILNIDSYEKFDYIPNNAAFSNLDTYIFATNTVYIGDCENKVRNSSYFTNILTTSSGNNYYRDYISRYGLIHFDYDNVKKHRSKIILVPINCFVGAMLHPSLINPPSNSLATDSFKSLPYFDLDENLIKEGNNEQNFIKTIQNISAAFEDIAEYIEAQGLNEREEEALIRYWDIIKPCYEAIDKFMK